MSDTAPEIRSWLQRLKSGLSRSKAALSDGLSSIFIKRQLDDAMLEELEDLLISADPGVSMAARVPAELAKTRYDKDIPTAEVPTVLENGLAPCRERECQNVCNSVLSVSLN